ncbi:esterase [Renibacterium salmoninarum ATCC 33209]|uniref:Esterase n=1 Tax=Renibacterium salmoninarum (strain ATCC 33209 / DSM 20767 / JCM 11484 / NBRC 15589 / NCIMB 2235) TaxID=288705 RepID=A9WQD8_RENSM|nr:serine hydrolase domain-containing protein [Renibacterium salmoninarum]ABY22588.1 esterase [Renibacterium salmoninarum ATCC 33209]
MTQGFVTDGYQPLADAFDSLFTDGLDDGASLAVYRDGKAVLDLWGGEDPHDGSPWLKDSVSSGFSTTKAAATICLLRLVERGLIDLDAPVATYWPEFTAAGKAGITVRQVSQHRSALPYLDAPVEDFFTPGKAEQEIAAQAPAYAVNSFFNYHAITFGTLVGEIVHRVSGKPVGEFFADEIATPLGLEFWIGQPTSVEGQFRRSSYPPLTLPAKVSAELLAQLPPATVAAVRTAEQLYELIPADSRESVANSVQFRSAQLAGASGVTNGRALARMYAAVIGEVDGIRLLSAETVEAARTYATDDIDKAPLPDGTVQSKPRWGIGFHLDDVASPMLGPGSFGHAGMGGRLGFAHPESGIGFGYVSQRMVLNPSPLPVLEERMRRLTEALREVI